MLVLHNLKMVTVCRRYALLCRKNVRSIKTQKTCRNPPIVPNGPEDEFCVLITLLSIEGSDRSVHMHGCARAFNDCKFKVWMMIIFQTKFRPLAPLKYINMGIHTKSHLLAFMSQILQKLTCLMLFITILI